jgi:hypothetical protein
MGRNVARLESESTIKLTGLTLVIDAHHLDIAKQWIEDFDQLISYANSYPQARWLTITIAQAELFLPRMRLNPNPEGRSESEENELQSEYLKYLGQSGQSEPPETAIEIALID